MSKASDNLIQSLRSTIARNTAERIERELIGFDEMGYTDSFESPIEQIFFLALCADIIRRGRVVRFTPGRIPQHDNCWAVRLDSARGPVTSTYTPEGRDGQPLVTDELKDQSGLFIGPAVSPDSIVRVFSQVEFKTYRLDFLVVDEWGQRVAIECDGHDYHERTKEQARRDRRRDRSLLTDGLPCLRFTGSEIFGDPNGCINDVFFFLEEAMLRGMGPHDS